MKLLSFILTLSLLITVQAEQIVKLTGQDKLLKVQKLNAKTDGSISYIYNGKLWIAPEFSYDYARIPKPREIITADRFLSRKIYPLAEQFYVKAYNRYKNLGWGVYCITGRAKALDGAGKAKRALVALERLKDVVAVDPQVKQELVTARMLHTDLLIKDRKYKEALALTEKLLFSEDDPVVFFAYDRNGDIAQLQKDKKEAVRNYLQAYYLISSHPRKAEVLYKAAVLLKELKDPRWKKFADILKKQYSNSIYAGKL